MIEYKTILGKGLGAKTSFLHMFFHHPKNLDFSIMGIPGVRRLHHRFAELAQSTATGQSARGFISGADRWVTRWRRTSRASRNTSSSTVVCNTVDGSEILPVEFGGLSHYLQGFIHPKWFSRRISEPSTVPFQNFI